MLEYHSLDPFFESEDIGVNYGSPIVTTQPLPGISSEYETVPPAIVVSASLSPVSDLIASLSRGCLLDSNQPTTPTSLYPSDSQLSPDDDLPQSVPEASQPWFHSALSDVVCSSKVPEQPLSQVRRSTRIFTSHKSPNYNEDDDADSQEKFPEPPERAVRTAKRKRDDYEYDISDNDSVSQKPISSYKKPKNSSSHRRKNATFPCPIIGCTETFGRKNDAERHVNHAAKHKTDREAMGIVPPPSMLIHKTCRFCKRYLSRSDARKRHEEECEKQRKGKEAESPSLS
jgi:hypothetical protein